MRHPTFIRQVWAGDVPKSFTQVSRSGAGQPSKRPSTSPSALDAHDQLGIDAQLEKGALSSAPNQVLRVLDQPHQRPDDVAELIEHRSIGMLEVAHRDRDFEARHRLAR
ncbi:MAG TPA: hypothetical protein VG755_46085 [Nannocystaceae bacterium]|nr:hypothetical protein [Nannocystaceae bacterium]